MNHLHAFNLVLAVAILTVVLIDLWVDLRHVTPARRRDALRALVAEGVAIAERTAAANPADYPPAERRRIAVEWVMQHDKRAARGEVSVLVEAALK